MQAGGLKALTWPFVLVNHSQQLGGGCPDVGDWGSQPRFAKLQQILQSRQPL